MQINECACTFASVKNRLLLFIALSVYCLCQAQVPVPQSSGIPNTISEKDTASENLITRSSINFKKRQWTIGGISALGYGGALLLLNEAWYKKYPKSNLHSFDDGKEWLQTDKAGHAWTAYNTSRATTAMWQWAGLPHHKAVWAGSISGFTFLTVIELLDARSAKWGWSWYDMGANVFGSALFAAQELSWQEQRVQFKFSSFPQKYAADLQQRTNQLFGPSYAERLLKDYNAQTYWLSFRLGSFFKESSLPPWLSLSLGYGASGMLGGFENKAFDERGNATFNRTDIPRRRQWYLSPDVDFTKIKSNRKGVRLLLSALNVLKVPAPAIEFSNGKLRGHWLFF